MQLITKKFPELSTANVTFYSDNKTTVVNGTRRLSHNVSGVLENYMDVTIEMTKSLRSVGLNINVEHVKGHQDDASDTDSDDELQPIAKINIDMDKAVGLYMQQLLDDRTATKPPDVFPGQQIRPFTNGKPVVTHIADGLSAAKKT